MVAPDVCRVLRVFAVLGPVGSGAGVRGRLHSFFPTADDCSQRRAEWFSSGDEMEMAPYPDDVAYNSNEIYVQLSGSGRPDNSLVQVSRGYRPLSICAALVYM